MLAALAEARQAATSTETYRLYTLRLAEYELCDVQEALEKLSRERRKEGETAFPDLPTITERVEQARIRRRRAEILKLRAECDCVDGWIVERSVEGSRARKCEKCRISAK